MSVVDGAVVDVAVDDVAVDVVAVDVVGGRRRGGDVACGIDEAGVACWRRRSGGNGR
jgi:hypothetical protein